MSLSLSDADKKYFINIFKQAPVKRPVEDIAAWVEGRRILGPPIPGLWRNSVTPYGIEIMNSLSPNSGIQRVTVMKARKIGLTTIFENCIAYYMLESPSEILYATANENLAKKWGNEKIIEVLESLGGLDRITAKETSAKGRRTGNTPERKEFIGGVLDIVSSQSTIAKRQLDKRCLFIDEVDGVEAVTSTGEGKWLPILIAHTNSYGVKKKIAIFGSPTVWETSLTREYYEAGDCRHFFVPCPYCGEPLELRLDIDGGAAYGLKAETKAGEITGAYYLCEHCGEAIRNEQKLVMFSEHPQAIKRPEKEVQKYHWRPAKKPDDQAWRSYYINALYSPIGMLTFTDIAKERATAELGDEQDQRSYINIYAGLPYKSAGSRPRLAKVMKHLGGYTKGTVPDGCLYLVAAVDVQKGYKKDPNRPERVEVMVMGIGKAYRSWIIDYRVFDGSTEDAYDGAWEKLHRWLCETHAFFYSADKTPFQLQMIFVDSGDASPSSSGESRSDEVYQFCTRYPGLAFPVKGFGRIKRRRGEDPDNDIPGEAAFKKYRTANIGTGGEYVVEISTARYKESLFSYLRKEKNENNPNPGGYLEIFGDAPDDFLIQLTNSERRKDDRGNFYFHDIGDHEVLDCAVYCLCAADCFLDAQIRQAEAGYRARGYRCDHATLANGVLNRLEGNITAFKAGQK